jgi:hypothetical protein
MAGEAAKARPAHAACACKRLHTLHLPAVQVRREDVEGFFEPLPPDQELELPTEQRARL